MPTFDANDAPIWQILCAAQDLLQTKTWDVKTGDHTTAIQDSSIVVRKQDAHGDRADWPHRDEDLPGIFITPAFKVAINASDGENKADDVVFPVLFQIADSDHSSKTGNLRTYSHWQYVLFQAFHNQRLSGVDLVQLCSASMIDIVDESMFIRHKNFKAAIRVDFLTRLTFRAS